MQLPQVILDFLFSYFISLLSRDQFGQGPDIMNYKDEASELDCHRNAATNPTDFRNYVKGAVVLLDDDLLLPRQVQVGYQMIMILVQMLSWQRLRSRFLKTQILCLDVIIFDGNAENRFVHRLFFL